MKYIYIYIYIYIYRFVLYLKIAQQYGDYRYIQILGWNQAFYLCGVITT